MLDFGFGLGLRSQHYTEILETEPQLDFFEIISENFMIPGGKPLYFLDKIRERYPMVMHGVSLSIGSTDPLNWDYLKQLKKLIQRVKPAWVSDHLCWTGIKGLNMHDLLPLPYRDETIRHVVNRLSEVQDFLGHSLLLENVSSYVSFKHSTMTEWEFLRTVVLEANCKLLLDVNNIYVSSFNHGFEPLEYLKGIPLSKVQQIHLAGHTNNGDHIIDTHDADIIDPVWDLYAKTIEMSGPIPTLIERDDNIPPLKELLLELDRARKVSGRFSNENVNINEKPAIIPCNS